MSVRFSIIVPVYNVERYLPDCFKSISEQTFRDYEVLLIDDGSTDSSGNLCDVYEKKNERVRTIHQPNGGLSVARNTGILNASGEYLLFLDSDDFLVGTDALERLASNLEQHPDLLIYPASEWDETANRLLLEQRIEIKEKKIFSAEEVLDYLYGVNDGVFVTMAPTKIVRREFCLLNQLFFLEGVFHEDDEWVARLLSFSPTIMFSSSAVYGYRHRQNSIITSGDIEKNIKRVEDRLRIGNSMLQLKTAETHSSVCLYGVGYFWGALCRIQSFAPDDQKRLFKTANRYTSAFRRFRYTRKWKWRFCAIVARLFGVRATVRFFKFIMKKQGD